jgi:hypothetical protein
VFANAGPAFFLLPILYVVFAAFLIFALIVLVRFLLVATRAAKLYVRDHEGPSKPPTA